jgi:alpha-methylacyl-CoA racemase
MGPLAGIKVIEIAGLGAAPYGCMMLADMGADVVRIDRIGGSGDTPETSPLLRNRRSVALDLKKSYDRDPSRDFVRESPSGLESGRKSASRATCGWSTDA